LVLRGVVKEVTQGFLILYVVNGVNGVNHWLQDGLGVNQEWLQYGVILENLVSETLEILVILEVLNGLNQDWLLNVESDFDEVEKNLVVIGVNEVNLGVGNQAVCLREFVILFPMRMMKIQSFGLLVVDLEVLPSFPFHMVA